LVEEGGFIYDSDAYNDDLPYHVEVNGKQHLVVPYSMTYNDAKFGVLPSYGAPSDFVENLKRGLDFLWEEGATHPRMMSIGLHPRLIGQASRVHALREFIEYAEKKGEVWFCRRIDIARWWHAHHAEFIS
jgi:peptidoglycan/xylan/chitin deacetylase (PgdA/CDA1 family)